MPTTSFSLQGQEPSPQAKNFTKEKGHSAPQAFLEGLTVMRWLCLGTQPPLPGLWGGSYCCHCHLRCRRWGVVSGSPITITLSALLQFFLVNLQNLQNHPLPLVARAAMAISASGQDSILPKGLPPNFLRNCFSGICYSPCPPDRWYLNWAWSQALI